jgi:hypothetical protein
MTADTLPPAASPIPVAGSLRRWDILWLVGIYVAGQAAVVVISLVFSVVYGLLVHPAPDPESFRTGDIAQGAIVAAIVIAAIVFFFGSLWLARRRAIGWQGLGFAGTGQRWYLAAVVAFILFFFFDAAVFRLLDPSGELQDELTNRLFLATGSLAWALAVALAAGPLTAVAEETFFRGLVFRWFRERWGAAFAIAASGVLFGLSHFYFVVPGGLAGWVLTGEIMVMGFLTAWLVKASGSLWPPILLHLLNNSSVVLVAFLAPRV